jgi:hypothetical protein
MLSRYCRRNFSGGIHFQWYFNSVYNGRDECNTYPDLNPALKARISPSFTGASGSLSILATVAFQALPPARNHNQDLEFCGTRSFIFSQ